MITPALIVPRGTQFLVFGGEDLIATCPTREEAEFWVAIYKSYQEELHESMKKTFYSHNESIGSRMMPMFIEEDFLGTSVSREVYWRCRYINPKGVVSYPELSQTQIVTEFTAIVFPKV